MRLGLLHALPLDERMWGHEAELPRYLRPDAVRTPSKPASRNLPSEPPPEALFFGRACRGTGILTRSPDNRPVPGRAPYWTLMTFTGMWNLRSTW